MSKFVKELLHSIYQDKDSWSQYAAIVRIDGFSIPYKTGIERNNVIIYNYGNSAILSIIRVKIENKDVRLTYWDCYKLEKAVTWWYKNVTLETLRK
jgi:hypothetical protein